MLHICYIYIGRWPRSPFWAWAIRPSWKRTSPRNTCHVSIPLLLFIIIYNATKYNLYISHVPCTPTLTYLYY